MQPSATSAQALQSLQTAQGQQKTPDQFLQAANQSLGVDQAQQTVTGLRSAINNTTNILNQVAPSVYATTAGTLSTAGQVETQIANASAPQQAKLTSESSDYNLANANYSDLEQQAQAQASNDLSAQNDQLSELQNVYQDLYSQEQAAQQAQTQQDQFNQQLAEQAREFNASESASSIATPSLGSTGTTNALQGGGPSGLTSNYRNGSWGFSYNGSGINAAQYAQLTGTPIRTVLQEMANKGDSGAKAALGFIGNDGNADPTKITNQNLANLYKALTGRTVAVYKAPAPSIHNQIVKAVARPSGIFGDNGRVQAQLNAARKAGKVR